MFPERVLSSDDLKPGKCILTLYNMEILPNYIVRTTPGVPVSYSTLSAIIGRKRETWCNRTRIVPKTFRPPHQVVHYELTGTCGTIDALIKRIYYGQLITLRRVTGEATAFIAGFTSNYGGQLPIDSRATAELVSAVAKTNEGDAQIGVMLGEAGETLNMLGSPLRLLQKPLSSLLPKRTTRLFRGSVHYASQAWLTARYGIIPLISDINAIRKVATRKLTWRDSPVRISRSARLIEVAYNKTDIKGGTGIPGVYAHGVKINREFQKISAKVYYKCRLTDQLDLGLSIYDVPNVIWELIPYSFVVDWFVNVGDWLQAIKPAPNKVTLARVVSTSNNRTLETSISGLSLNQVVSATYPMTGASCDFKHSAKTYQRNLTVPLPGSPQVNVSLSSFKRQLDGVTLLYQRLPRLR